MASAASGLSTQAGSAPAARFKLLLVGHLENLTSNRAIIRKSQLRLDVLYFLDYAVGQPLPWHSTLSRTRQRLLAALFEACFQRILAICAEAGMVSGDTQAIDSAFVQASASLDSLKANDLAGAAPLNGAWRRIPPHYQTHLACSTILACDG